MRRDALLNMIKFVPYGTRKRVGVSANCHCFEEPVSFDEFRVGSLIDESSRSFGLADDQVYHVCML